MQTDRELLQMALDALEESKKHLTDHLRNRTIEALRARLAQGEPEPVKLPDFPERESLADLPYAQETPESWDDDYRDIWQKLQVAERNNALLRRHIRELRALYTAPQQPAVNQQLTTKPEPVCDWCKGLGYYDEGHENDDGTMSGGDYVECEKCKPKQQEPVAWGVPNTRPTEKAQFMMLLHKNQDVQYPDKLVPLYAAPPQREFIGLTDEERDEICLGDEAIARAIEQALRKKNNG